MWEPASQMIIQVRNWQSLSSIDSMSTIFLLWSTYALSLVLSTLYKHSKQNYMVAIQEYSALSWTNPGSHSSQMYIHNHIKLWWQHKVLWLPLTSHLYQLSLLAGRLDSIQCLHRADISLYLSTSIGTSMCRGPLENIASVFMLASPAVPTSYLSNLDGI